MKTKSLLFLVLGITVTIISSCTKEKEKDAITDQEIIAIINESGFSYYSSDTIAADGPHVPYIMVRFNSTAKSVLNEDNSIEPGQSFPEGSAIVKEIYNTKGGELVRKYVMIKKPSDSNANIGWVWAAYSADNATEHSVNLKGVGCFECHSLAPNRDGVKLFDVH